MSTLFTVEQQTTLRYRNVLQRSFRDYTSINLKINLPQEASHNSSSSSAVHIGPVSSSGSVPLHSARLGGNSSSSSVQPGSSLSRGSTLSTSTLGPSSTEPPCSVGDPASYNRHAACDPSASSFLDLCHIVTSKQTLPPLINVGNETTRNGGAQDSPLTSQAPATSVTAPSTNPSSVQQQPAKQQPSSLSTAKTTIARPLHVPLSSGTTAIGGTSTSNARPMVIDVISISGRRYPGFAILFYVPDTGKGRCILTLYAEKKYDFGAVEGSLTNRVRSHSALSQERGTSPASDPQQGQANLNTAEAPSSAEQANAITTTGAQSKPVDGIKTIPSRDQVNMTDVATTPHFERSPSAGVSTASSSVRPPASQVSSSGTTTFAEVADQTHFSFEVYSRQIFELRNANRKTHMQCPVGGDILFFITPGESATKTGSVDYIDLCGPWARQTNVAPITNTNSTNVNNMEPNPAQLIPNLPPVAVYSFDPPILMQTALCSYHVSSTLPSGTTPRVLQPTTVYDNPHIQHQFIISCLSEGSLRLCLLRLRRDLNFYTTAPIMGTSSSNNSSPLGKDHLPSSSNNSAIASADSTSPPRTMMPPPSGSPPMRQTTGTFSAGPLVASAGPEVRPLMTSRISETIPVNLNPDGAMIVFSPMQQDSRYIAVRAAGNQTNHYPLEWGVSAATVVTSQPLLLLCGTRDGRVCVLNMDSLSSTTGSRATSKSKDLNGIDVFSSGPDEARTVRNFMFCGVADIGSVGLVRRYFVYTDRSGALVEVAAHSLHDPVRILSQIKPLDRKTIFSVIPCALPLDLSQNFPYALLAFELDSSCVRVYSFLESKALVLTNFAQSSVAVLGGNPMGAAVAVHTGAQNFYLDPEMDNVLDPFGGGRGDNNNATKGSSSSAVVKTPSTSVLGVTSTTSNASAPSSDTGFFSKLKKTFFSGGSRSPSGDAFVSVIHHEHYIATHLDGFTKRMTTGSGQCEKIIALDPRLHGFLTWVRFTTLNMQFDEVYLCHDRVLHEILESPNRAAEY